ncbi:uncharacterized protein EI97DRAFT_389679, partial [Westerdykella ornata]
MAPEADTPQAVAGIKPLPPTTVRQIGASQVLVDPSSVVKELIDNALDARASAVFVDISANTITSIQVKDNGHGIPAEDRALVCRRYCTSKIRDFQDLRQVGGKWLGFRGEAMASMAEMSGSLEVVTRVEGEPVAVLLKYGKNGELEKTERASHPVGTTVKVTDLFGSFPVRKQDALKHSAKWLARIRRLMQAYALARPTVRFQLRVLKAKTDKGNFNYAPKAGAKVEDAAFKVIGRNCASQCEWTALEFEGYEVHAFLPKADAIGEKIANEGTFLAVDSRPVSSNRGTMKKIAAAFKEHLRKANPALASVKDPFCCMNIICPPESYDPNIEPAKDDVLFENPELVLSAVEKLLDSFYPVAKRQEPETVPPSKPQLDIQPQYLDVKTSASLPPAEEFASSPSKPDPKWRSTMYGVDEEDLHLLSDNPPPNLEEEEGARAAEVSNPWTIAKMNAAMKPKKRPVNPQLLTPTKTPGGLLKQSSSPMPIVQPAPVLHSSELTPERSSPIKASQSSLDAE